MGLLSKIATFFIRRILRLPDTVSTVGADVLIDEAVSKAPIKTTVPTVSTIVPTMYRKYISMIAYDNPKRQFYAITFEDNEEDREQELVQALIEFFGSEGFVFASDYGYSQDEANGMPLYPDIETGYL